MELGLEGAASQIKPDLAQCQRRLGYVFHDPQRLVSALTHASGALDRLASNERLEFLGDAILGFIVCEMLYERFPELLEGDLTKIKSVVVSRQTCARASAALGLHEFLILGKGMSSDPTIPPSVLAAVYESIVAAIYQDGGYAAVKPFIEQTMSEEIELAAAGESEENYKSMLQQLVQREYAATPVYHVLDEKGPDHSKCFKISAQVGAVRYPSAWGRSKKEAEQRAAHNALSQLSGLPIPHNAQ
jgi:ribonuclease-3